MISDQYVLTAAHCIYPEDETWVGLGEHDIAVQGEVEYFKVSLEK